MPLGDLIVVQDDVEYEEELKATHQLQDVLRSLGDLKASPWSQDGKRRKALETVIEKLSQLDTGEMDVTTIQRSTADAHLCFPPGHPQSRVVYIQHPLVGTIYYPAFAFHPLTFEHKLGELLRLLPALGASKVDLRYEKGYGRELLFPGTEPEEGKRLAQLLPHVAIKGRGEKKAEMSLSFSSEGPGHGKPHLPKDLVWFEHEPMWRALADARLDGGVRQWNLAFTYHESFGITADVIGKIAKAKLRTGGKFQDYKETTWSLQVAFP